VASEGGRVRGTAARHPRSPRPVRRRPARRAATGSSSPRAATPGRSPRLWLAARRGARAAGSRPRCCAARPGGRCAHRPFPRRRRAAGAVDAPGARAGLRRRRGAARATPTSLRHPRVGRRDAAARGARARRGVRPRAAVAARDGAAGGPRVAHAAGCRTPRPPRARPARPRRRPPAHRPRRRGGPARGRVAAERAGDPDRWRPTSATPPRSSTRCSPPAGRTPPRRSRPPGVPGAPALRERPRARGPARQPRGRSGRRADRPGRRGGASARRRTGRGQPPELRTAEALLDVLDGVLRPTARLAPPGSRRTSRPAGSPPRCAATSGRSASWRCSPPSASRAYSAGRSFGTLQSPPGRPRRPAHGPRLRRDDVRTGRPDRA
jgi:hypothetical protein